MLPTGSYAGYVTKIRGSVALAGTVLTVRTCPWHSALLTKHNGGEREETIASGALRRAWDTWLEVCSHQAFVPRLSDSQTASRDERKTDMVDSAFALRLNLSDRNSVSHARDRAGVQQRTCSGS